MVQVCYKLIVAHAALAEIRLLLVIWLLRRMAELLMALLYYLAERAAWQ